MPSPRLAIAALAFLALAAAGSGGARAELLVVRAERLYPAAGPVISDAAVVIRDERIVAVGPAASVQVPSGAQELRAPVVTPGLIDAHTSVGLSGLRNVAAVLDQDEATDPDQADLRALDAFDPREPLLRYLLEHGVTLVQTGPGPSVPIAGQAGIFRTVGASADEMAVRAPSALVFNLGESPKTTFGAKDEFPSTRMGTAALIRRRLREAVEASQRGWLGSIGAMHFDARADILERVARGRLPAIFVAHRADDILTAMRITREFGLRSVLSGATEAYLVADRVQRAGLGILAGPVMERPGTPERENASYESPLFMSQAGIAFAFRSGFEGYVPRNRVVLYEASVAVANGLASDAALRALTLGAAELLEVADDYGSLESGKIADLVLFDGDPFEYTTHVEAVVAAGRVVHRREP